MAVDAAPRQVETARGLDLPPSVRESLRALLSFARASGAPLTRPWIAVPLGIGLASRVVVALLGYFSIWLVPDNPLFIRADYSRNAWLESWFNWDAGWYTAIAFRGYTTVGPDAPSVAFWPLLPLLEAAVGKGLLGLLLPGVSESERVAVAGLLLVFLAFLAMLVVAYRLMLSYASPEVARRTVCLLAFAPGALYFTAPYPDTLLCLGVVGCLLALHRRRWLAAGLAGGWAAAAQVPGCLLVFPFLWSYVAYERRLRPSVLWGLLIPLPPALWLLYLGVHVGDPLAPIHAAETYWSHTWAWPWQTIHDALLPALDRPSEHALRWLNLAATFGAILASGWALLRGPRAWGVWGLAVVTLYLVVPAREPLEGVVRYGLPVLPVWLVAAHVCRHPIVEAGVLGLFAAFQGLLVALYVNGYWVA
jgi:hypothetical protein